MIETVVREDVAGGRLDTWLAGRFTYNSRNQWREAVRTGTILIDGRRVRPSTTLRAGMRISFHPEERPEPPVNSDFSLVHEDRHILVVDKPGNIPCHPGGAYFANTLWRILKKRFGDIHLAGRLDRETSGLIVAARTSAAAAEFAQRKKAFAEKRYLALLHGRFPENEILAEGFMRDRTPDDLAAGGTIRKKRVYSAVANHGFEWETASTVFKTVARGALKNGGGEVSLVEASLKTGRTHQIRATTLALGYPIVGDKTYGLDERFFAGFAEGTLSDEDRKLLVLERQALHCAGISFRHPESGETLSFESPLPAEIAETFNFNTGETLGCSGY